MQSSLKNLQTKLSFEKRKVVPKHRHISLQHMKLSNSSVGKIGRPPKHTSSIQSIESKEFSNLP